LKYEQGCQFIGTAKLTAGNCHLSAGRCRSIKTKNNKEKPLKSFVSLSPLISDTSQVALIGDCQSILRLHWSTNWYSCDPNCTVSDLLPSLEKR